MCTRAHTHTRSVLVLLWAGGPGSETVKQQIISVVPAVVICDQFSNPHKSDKFLQRWPALKDQDGSIRPQRDLYNGQVHCCWKRSAVLIHSVRHVWSCMFQETVWVTCTLTHSLTISHNETQLNMTNHNQTWSITIQHYSASWWIH